MRKPILLTLMLVLAVLVARGQNCNQVVIHNGMSSYRSASSDGVNISASTSTSGSDSMSPPSGCPPFNGGQPPGSPRHTADSTVTISSAGNQLQNPNFTSGTAGWQWQQNPGGAGGWVLGQGGLPSPPGGIGSLAVYQGIGTAAVANLQHILVNPGNAVTASVWGLGEPGALGQALLRVDWYGASGNLVSVSNSPTPVTNNYVWTQLRFSATAPAGATYAIVDFAIIGKTTTTGRWFVYGFTATVGQTTTSSYMGCWDCFLSATASVSLPGDDNWDISFASDTMCSSAGEVFYQASDEVVPSIYVNAGGNTPYGVKPPISATVSSIASPAPTGTINFSMLDDSAPPAEVAYEDDDVLVVQNATSSSVSWSFNGNGFADPPIAPEGPISPGNYTATASYSGDSNYVAGPPGSDSLKIELAGTQVTMACPAATVTAGKTISILVTVARLQPSTLYLVPSPSGTVTLTGTGITPSPQAVFTSSPSAQSRSVTISFSLSKGSYTIGANYSGDGNYNLSTSESTSACKVTAQ